MAIASVLVEEMFSALNTFGNHPRNSALCHGHVVHHCAPGIHRAQMITLRVQFGLCDAGNNLKDGRFANAEVSKHLAIEFDVRTFQTMHEIRVAELR